MNKEMNESAINYMPGFNTGYISGYKDGYAKVLDELIKARMSQPLKIALCFKCGKEFKEEKELTNE